jgi:hypothetical protein
MGFRNLDPTTDVFLVQDATNCRFQSVGFYGPLVQADLINENADTAGVRFASGVTLVTGQIVFDNCEFSGTTFGTNTATDLGGTDQEVDGVTVQNSYFNLLYQGVVLGTVAAVNGGARGFRVVGNKFDNIYADGVVFGPTVSLNATAHNAFYGVGNHFGSLSTPYTACINIQNANNISISDLFERGDAYSLQQIPGTSFPRINLNNTASIATTNGSELAMGTYIRQSGKQFILLAGQAVPQTIFTIDSTVICTFNVNYTIIRDTACRTGTIQIASDPISNVTSIDTYTENTTTGITLSVTQALDTVTLSYVSTGGVTGTFNYSINYLP